MSGKPLPAILLTLAAARSSFLASCFFYTMSQPREPDLVKLIIRFLFSDYGTKLQALHALVSDFGPMDFLSTSAPFLYTTYYDKEMGQAIRRQTAGFLNLVAPGSLPDIKLRTNEIEIRLSRNGKRQVNIDPGLLSLERFVLATGKDFTHRVYLRDGIYADLTFIYSKGAYSPLPWTYPDYREPQFLHYLEVLRKKLRFQRYGILP
ncbi:MAG TPA: DUF4416 family protein [Syntrophobacteraceae bacterium]|nr:DUF4416 family protein [Syntrophobacteraceae bacterium]